MARATAICKCEKCGKEFKKMTTKSNRREANSWEEWAVSHFTVCPECYGKECREKEAAEGLRAIVNYEVFEESFQICIKLKGNTYPIKESVKALGCKWDGFTWNAEITVKYAEFSSIMEEVKTLISALENMGFKVLDEDEEAKEQIKAGRKNFKKPEIKRPEILKGNWNGKIYGKEERYIFLNNVKTYITSEDEKEINLYMYGDAKGNSILSETLDKHIEEPCKGVTRSYKVYGYPGHRQRESFCESYRLDFSEPGDVRVIEVENSDKTGTNDYSVVRITRNTAQECEEELEGQLYDGIFENSRVGRVVDII